jgi:hypothetical protein
MCKYSNSKSLKTVLFVYVLDTDCSVQLSSVLQHLALRKNHILYHRPTLFSLNTLFPASITNPK